jgi:hypothetical protein
MVELKVLCPCGTKFVFDVEPVDGHIPVPVGCPACGRDATELADAELAAKIPAAPAPSAATAPRLSVIRPSPAEPASRIEPLAGTPVRGNPKPVKASATTSGEGSVMMGVVGALVGGFVGMLVWYGMIRFLNFEIGYVAWGVGALTGVCARLFGRQGRPVLGAVAAVVAFAAIMVGEGLGVGHAVTKYLEKEVSGAYEEQMVLARQLPEKPSDKDLLALLKKEATDAGEDGATFGDEDVKAFRNDRLPVLQDLSSGKVTKQQYEHRIAAAMAATIPFMAILKNSVGILTAVFVLLGVGSAWKIASSEG